VKVSLHPAQAAPKPCVNRAGQRGNFPRDLDDMHLQPADWTRTFESVELVRVCCPAEGRTHGLRHVHLLFPSAQVLRVFPSRTTHWKSARLHGGTMLPSLSIPLRNGLRFFQHPLPAIPTTLLAESSASMRRNVGFTMFRSNSDDDLAPAYYTGSRSDPCARTLKADNLTAYRLVGAGQRLWLFTFDDACGSSPGLGVSSSLALRPP